MRNPPLSWTVSVLRVVGFFTFMLLTGIASMMIGWAALVDWRGLGTRYFHWIIQLPGWRLWEEWGPRNFLFTMGGVAILGGAMFSITAVVNLA